MSLLRILPFSARKVWLELGRVLMSTRKQKSVLMRLVSSRLAEKLRAWAELYYRELATRGRGEGAPVHALSPEHNLSMTARFLSERVSSFWGRRVRVRSLSIHRSVPTATLGRHMMGQHGQEGRWAAGRILPSSLPPRPFTQVHCPRGQFLLTVSRPPPAQNQSLHRIPHTPLVYAPPNIMPQSKLNPVCHLFMWF